VRLKTASFEVQTVKKEPIPNLLENLRDFLSTDTRKRLFFHYVFTKTAPSDLAESTNTPISTVDMVTNSLRLMELLNDVEGEDKNKNYYQVDMTIWLYENLRSLGFGFIKDEQKYEILKILAERQFLALSFILTNPDFAMGLYKRPLKMGEDLIVFKLMRLFTTASLVADMLSYILMSVLVFPSFRQLKQNMDSKQGVKEAVELINSEAAKHPYLADVLKNVNEETLKDYTKKRADLAHIMERLIEQNLQFLSTQEVKKAAEAKKEAEEEKKEEEPKEGAEETPEKDETPKEAEKSEEVKEETEEPKELKEAEPEKKKPKKVKKRKKKEEKKEEPKPEEQKPEEKKPEKKTEDTPEENPEE
jgi:hypothetical protein